MKRGLICAAALALVVRLALAASAEDSLLTWMKDSITDGSLINATISFELGATQSDGDEDYPSADETVTSASLSDILEAPADPSPSASGAVKDGDDTDDGGVSYIDDSGVQIIETTISKGVAINNSTSYTIDTGALLSEGSSLALSSEGPQILIIHTHASEAYTQDSTDRYIATDSYRTEDINYNVVRVGDELEKVLTSYGLDVIHDRGIYDYPSYTGSYLRSGEAIEDYLEQYPTISIVIDLHRDALGSGDVVYKTAAALDGSTSSQVMFVVGTDESGLEHPEWRENLKLALTLQDALESTYPTLARPISLKTQRYNQQLSIGSLLLEVGSSGNTLQESITAVKLFGQAVGPLFKSMIQ